MENSKEQIYLTALLHDIGKFYRLADPGDVTTSHFLSSDIQDSAEVFLPS